MYFSILTFFLLMRGIFVLLGEDKILGTDEGVFIEVLTSNSFAQLSVIFEQYSKLCDYDIGKSFKRETSFMFKRALTTIVAIVQDPPRSAALFFI